MTTAMIETTGTTGAAKATAGEKTYTCAVRYSRLLEWVEVTGKARTLRLEATKHVAYNASDEDAELIEALMTGASPRAEELTGDKMRRFAALVAAQEVEDREGVSGAAPAVVAIAAQEPAVGSAPAVVAQPIAVVAAVAAVTPTVAQKPVGATAAVAPPVEMARTVAAVVRAVQAIEARQGAGQGLDDEGRVRRMERAKELLRGGIWQMNYYHPKVLKIKNPARMFRKYGFSLDGSNWVFTTAGLRAPAVRKALAEWDAMEPIENVESGIVIMVRPRHWEIPYSMEAIAAMRDAMQDQIAKELQEIHRSLIRRIDGAARDLEKAQAALAEKGEATERNLDKVENAYNGRIRATIKDACETFASCLKGAELFDDTGSLDALFQTKRDVIKAQALAVNALLASKGAKPVAIPAEVMG